MTTAQKLEDGWLYTSSQQARQAEGSTSASSAPSPRNRSTVCSISASVCCSWAMSVLLCLPVEHTNCQIQGMLTSELSSKCRCDRQPVGLAALLNDHGCGSAPLSLLLVYPCVAKSNSAPSLKVPGAKLIPAGSFCDQEASGSQSSRFVYVVLSALGSPFVRLPVEVAESLQI